MKPESWGFVDDDLVVDVHDDLVPSIRHLYGRVVLYVNADVRRRSGMYETNHVSYIPLVLFIWASLA
ncbi:Uncharacterised protein [Actinobaculum suis]|uniref:Uncharacterized protein n=1 Tax=Actinobaculum suis TaxID=1657 RepID=A0A7Z9C8C4_9ACTO|nr:Uncharacterised protein [Actinobaculum suis]VDG79599.1 Uncharacterised protein [Actinobaculum suis]